MLLAICMGLYCAKPFVTMTSGFWQSTATSDIWQSTCKPRLPLKMLLAECMGFSATQKMSGQRTISLTYPRAPLYPVALAWVTRQCASTKPEGGEALFLPTLDVGKIGLTKCWVLPLVTKLPKLHKQPVKVTSDSGPATDLQLVTYRVTFVQSTMSKDAWETTKRNPPLTVKKVMGDKVHSCYGWREEKVANRTGSPEILLQGFLRTGSKFDAKVLQHDGKGGLFLQKVGDAQGLKRPVWWEQKLADETPSQYYARVSEDAAKEGVSIGSLPAGGGGGTFWASDWVVRN